MIPDGVTTTVKDGDFSVKGPRGELKLTIPDMFKISLENDQLTIVPQKNNKRTSALWGTTRALVANLIQGVAQGYEKKLELEGVGYSVALDGKNLVFKLGFSHPVKVACPEGIQFTVEKNLITVIGIDKQLVGQTAAVIRSKKKPEPYKGKGIHYLGEVIKRKAGKKVAGSS